LTAPSQKVSSGPVVHAPWLPPMFEHEWFSHWLGSEEPPAPEPAQVPGVPPQSASLRHASELLLVHTRHGQSSPGFESPQERSDASDWLPVDSTVGDEPELPLILPASGMQSRL